MNTALLALAYQALKQGLCPDKDPLAEALAYLADALHLLPAHIDPQPIAPLPASGARQRIALCLGHAPISYRQLETILDRPSALPVCQNNLF